MARHDWRMYVAHHKGNLLSCSKCPMLVPEEAMNFSTVRDSECVGAEDIVELPDEVPAIEWARCAPDTGNVGQALLSKINRLTLQHNHIIRYLRAKENDAKT